VSVINESNADAAYVAVQMTSSSSYVVNERKHFPSYNSTTRDNLHDNNGKQLTRQTPIKNSNTLHQYETNACKLFGYNAVEQISHMLFVIFTLVVFGSPMLATYMYKVHSNQRFRFGGSLADIVHSTNLLTYLLSYSAQVYWPAAECNPRDS